jgi:deferrochelatase/peroxidase EfeB
MSNFNNPASNYIRYPKYYPENFRDLIESLPSENSPTKYDDLLDDIQANILSHHRKNFSWFYFIHFKGRIEKALRWIEALSQYITTAKAQFENHRNSVCCFYLSGKGYSKLGLENVAQTILTSKAFEEGMRGRLAFPLDENYYEETLHPKERGQPLDIHAMLMVASDRPDFSDVDEGLLGLIVKLDKGDWAVHTRQTGLMKRKFFKGQEPNSEKKRRAVDWFGFRDGISQPLFFPDKQGIESFSRESLSPLKIALIKDNGGHPLFGAGSFLAFMKIELDVKAFRKNVKRIATALDINDELAEAYIMGRFQDGTSVSLSSTPKNYDHPENDFNYSRVHKSMNNFNGNDNKGIRCPFYAHARKANPRDEENARFILRRGVLYDDRVKNNTFNNDDTNWEDWNDENNAPEKGLGMLFMSFQSNLEYQFEYIVNEWMFGLNTDTQATGIDMLAGAGANWESSQWFLPKKWSGKNLDEKILFTSEMIRPCAHFKGGEYFFAPSKSHLKKVMSNSTGRSKRGENSDD